MKILLTNDDGFRAEGINVLAEYLSRKNEVFIVAPSENRSAVSHAITMDRDLELREIRKNVWSCSGVPVDCVVTALKSSLLPSKPDVVVSGINAGANIGTDILYSGTAAAARQAVIYGVPAAAFSLEFNDGKLDHYNALAEFAADNLETIVSLADTDYPSVFVNVNALSLEKYKGVKITDELSLRDYSDFISLRKSGDGYASVFHGNMPESSAGENCDYSVCMDGYISVSRVYAEPQACRRVDGVRFSL